MKHGKRPTRAQRKIMIINNLDPNAWLISTWSPAGALLVHKETGELKEIKP